MSWIAELLPADKKNRIEHLMTFPLSTNELMKDIFMGLERVWYAKNFIQQYTFASDEYEHDFLAYLKQIKSDHMWRVEAWSSMKTAIDSVVIIDLPAVQNGLRPEPYFYFISPHEILDMGVDGRNDMQYIIFEHDNEDGVNELIVYDSEQMRKYAYDKKQIGALIAKVPHDLGYCPARMFWSDKLQDENYINKRSPVTDSLGDLDWLLFFKTSKKYLDLHAPYPIYITYEIESEKEREDKPTWWEGQEQTKKHTGQGFMGPGSFSTVPVPRTGEPDLMGNPIQVVGAEVEACQYSAEEVDRLANDIYRSCVGSDGDLLRKEAVNEKQVDASFKSREEVLINIARNFAEIMLWTNETLARLRYGVFFIDGMVEFGEDFYLQTEQELIASYADAKSKGVNQVLLDAMDEQIMDTKFKHKKRDRERAMIYKDLDPMPGMSITEAAVLVGKGVSLADLTMKVNLLKFVRRFEMEFGDVVDFMSDDYAEKIEIINLKLQDYAREQEPNVQPQGE